METFNFKHINLKKVKNMVDVGCGNGRHLKSLGFKVKEAEIIGIDQSFNEISSYKSEFIKKNNYCHSYFFSPIEGRMLIFPSYLQHHVEVNNSEGDRISISFNIDLINE